MYFTWGTAIIDKNIYTVILKNYYMLNMDSRTRNSWAYSLRSTPTFSSFPLKTPLGSHGEGLFRVAGGRWGWNCQDHWEIYPETSPENKPTLREKGLCHGIILNYSNKGNVIPHNSSPLHFLSHLMEKQNKIYGKQELGL